MLREAAAMPNTKRTQLLRGVCIEPRNGLIAGAEIVFMIERNMSRAATRGSDVLPGSQTTSRAKGSRRNLGDLVSGRQALRERDGPHREGEEP